jgi:1-acyl-sn-glycerol-3-phosphate acyltransferase
MLGMRLDREDWFARALLTAARALAVYHRHRVVHLERVGRLLREGRRVVLVGNHALSVIDPLLLAAQFWGRYGVVPRFIGHENGWFRTPVLRTIAEWYHVLPSRDREAAADALRQHGLLMVFPGSNTEAAVRDYRAEPYRLKWNERMGFLRLALDCDAEILFVAAVGSDEAYYQSRVPVPEVLLRHLNNGDGARYRGARLTFGLLGPQLFPGTPAFPVRMTHVVSPALDLGDRREALRDPAALAALHTRVWAECQSFLDTAVARRGRHTDFADRIVRGAQNALRRVGA